MQLLFLRGVIVSCLATVLVAAEPESTEVSPLVDLATCQPVLDAGNFHLELSLGDVVKHRKGTADLPVHLSYWNGAWQVIEVKSDHLRGYRWEVTGELAFDAAQKQLRGDMRIVGKRGDPGREQEQAWDCKIAADLVAIDLVRADPKRVEGRFWTVFPRSQGQAYTVEGTAHVSGVFEGATSVSGSIAPPLKPGHWNMGTYTADKGLAWRFAMGTERRTWNYVRLAQMEFGEPKDLSRVQALRLRVTSPTPRDDVELSVWLREGDGSWYYIKKAVPLSAANNEAILHLADFREAEWVAPGSHIDEDYVFDRRAVSHIAVGIVNSLGVGDVRCSLQGIDALSWAVPALPPARAVSTADLLSVNGHDIVPAGIFGGYAPHLPQEYRPGCQRDLYPPGYPRVPKQRGSVLRKGAFADWPGFVLLLQGKADDAPAAHRDFVAHCASLLGDDKDLTWLRTRYQLARELDRAKKRNREANLPKQVTQVMTRLMRRVDFYKAEAWPRIELDEGLQARLTALRAGEYNDTQAMDLHRDLLALAFPALIKARQSYGPTEIFQIDCYGERLHPANLLHDPNWEKSFHNFGRTYAGNCRKAGYGARLEFWNEPYLNWAERSRVNLKSKYYRTKGVKAGDPVQVLYKDRDGVVTPGPTIPHFQWVEDGNGGLKVIDTTAFSYFAGRGNGWIYDTMLKAMATGVKAVDPSVPVIAGWGFRWHEDHWAAWPLLYKPTIDNNIEWIDGIHEHHYQGDTTAMNGSYEVLIAYGKTAHDKWLHCYNTETNDLVDAPARGVVDTPEKAKRASQYRRMVYNLRDCLYCVLESPDKLQSRTVIHQDHTPDAIRVAYGLLKDLRGRLVHGTSSETGVWSVASVDGSDPASPPPEPGLKLVAFVYNDNRYEREIHWRVQAPTGTTFSGPAQLSVTTVDPESFELGIKESQHGTDGQVDSLELKVTLPPRMGARVRIPLDGSLPAEPTLVRDQYFSADILQRITRAQPFSTTVTVPTEQLSGIEQAWLRVVVEDVAEGEAVVQLNGESLVTLPKRLTPDNGNAILMLPIPVDRLQAENRFVFSLGEGNHAAYRVDMCSIVLDR